MERGRGDELEALVDEAEAATGSLRTGHYHHSVAYARAALLLLRGDPAAEAAIQEAARVGHHHGLAAGHGGFVAQFAGPVDHWLGLLASTLGRREDAERHQAQAAAFCHRLGAPRWEQRCRDALTVTGSPGHVGRGP